MLFRSSNRYDLTEHIVRSNNAVAAAGDKRKGTTHAFLSHTVVTDYKIQVDDVKTFSLEFSKVGRRSIRAAHIRCSLGMAAFR